MLTVISACYNAVTNNSKKVINRCVESVAKLPFAHEHLIMDGESNDGTKEFLESLAYPFVKVYSEKDTSIYDALNKGLIKASGDYVYVLGLDDFIEHPTKMKEAYEIAVKGKYDLVISPVRSSDRSFFPSRKRAVYDSYYIGGYCHQGEMIRTEVLRAQGGYDTKYRIVSDFKSNCIAHLQGARVKYLDCQYAFFNSTGISSDRNRIIDEYSSCIREIYPEGKLLELSQGIIPFSSVFRLIFSRSLFSVRMGLRALRRRVVRVKKSPKGKEYRLFEIVIFTRKRRMADEDRSERIG